MDLQRLGELLRARRADFPIKAVAKQCRISPNTYRLTESCRRRPQIRTCYRLAGFLDMPPEEVLKLAGYLVAQGSASPAE